MGAGPDMADIGEDDLGRLFDDADFAEVHARMARFNLFEAVGAVRGELRHSNFLAHLLSPNRSHGLGQVVLENVLRAVLELIPPERRPVMTLELRVADLGDAIVYRERDNIDLLIEIDSLDLVVVIENKVDSKAGDGQLERYRVMTESRYPARRKLYVYLTPTGADSEHPSYTAFSYVRLAEVLESLLDNERSVIAPEPAVIIRHYVEMLRRHIVPDERLQDLARRLYERHSEALDFIFECRPQQGGLLEAMQDRIESVAGLAVDSRFGNGIRFFPDAWDQALQSLACGPTDWSRTGRGLLFEVKTFPKTPGRVNLSLIMGPAATDVRTAFYEAAKAKPEIFTGLVKPMGLKWVTIFSRDLLTSAQARGLSLDQQAANASLAWSDFQGRQLQELIQEILRIEEHRAATIVPMPTVQA
ncbi:MAG: hypothetical protein JWL84_2417 [Rhodospirillales bacterium]|nr:hypothetical protein [Rhodospirillales bacterium]